MLCKPCQTFFAQHELKSTHKHWPFESRPWNAFANAEWRALKPLDNFCSFCTYLVNCLPDVDAREELETLGRYSVPGSKGGGPRGDFVTLRYELCVENEIYTDEDAEYPPYTLDISYVSGRGEIRLHFPSLTLIDLSSV